MIARLWPAPLWSCALARNRGCVRTPSGAAFLHCRTRLTGSPRSPRASRSKQDTRFGHQCDRSPSCNGSRRSWARENCKQRFFGSSARTLERSKAPINFSVRLIQFSRFRSHFELENLASNPLGSTQKLGDFVNKAKRQQFVCCARRTA